MTSALHHPTVAEARLGLSGIGPERKTECGASVAVETWTVMAVSSTLGDLSIVRGLGVIPDRVTRGS
jgi:hypothetical protein